MKCDKMKILIFYKMSEKDNVIILENIKYCIVKNAPSPLKLE